VVLNDGIYIFVIHAPFFPALGVQSGIA